MDVPPARLRTRMEPRHIRLLDVRTLELKEFFDAPAYAILSHTWGDEEVSFKDITSNPRVQSMKGYKKIRYACGQAVNHRFEYVWCDTCCIDKSSSAELSEAINSMWSYYHDSAMCYAYIEDVVMDATKPNDQVLGDFSFSRWFTRSWTLQELIAPWDVIFYDMNWNEIGYRTGKLLSIIHFVTNIPKEILETYGRGRVSTYSIAARMSWAARRSCTRVEDEAYSLLGIFDISMPMLYGEGRKAFIRLQRKIIKTSTDHSFLTHGDGGLFATTPHYFRDCGDIEACSPNRPMDSFSLTNRGLQITLPVVETVGHTMKQIEVALNCRTNGNLVTVRLEQRKHADSSSDLPLEYLVIGKGGNYLRTGKETGQKQTIVIVP